MARKLMMTMWKERDIPDLDITVFRNVPFEIPETVRGRKIDVDQVVQNLIVQGFEEVVEKKSSKKEAE